MVRWKVALLEPPGHVRILELNEGRFLVGSDESAEVCVHSPGVAPRHLVLHLGSGRVEVELLAGAPAVRLNGHALEGSRECAGSFRVELGEACLEIAPFASKQDDKTVVIRHAHALAQDGAFAEPLNAPEQTLRICLPTKVEGADEETLAFEVLEGPEDARAAVSNSQSASSDGSQTVVFDVSQTSEDPGRNAVSQNGYLLETEIARGGMGRIFDAQDPGLHRRVAVKVSAVAGPGGEEQFRREAEVLARLAHPNIVPVHSSGTTDTGRPFYAMKLVEGKTLKAILRELAERQPATVEHYTRERLLNVFRKVCDAVGFAHAEGYLHRDLKPENVMVGAFGEVLVMDWGLARRVPGWGEVGGVPEALAAVRYIEGSPQYMSPEQAEGLALDERSDIYALGTILYSILTLRAPIEGSSVKEVLEKVKRCEVRDITTRRAVPAAKGAPVLGRGPVPEALRAITLKAMAGRRERRYATVAELVSDIEFYQNGFATSAENAGVHRQVFLLMKRHRAASALLCLMLVGGLGFTKRLVSSNARLAQSNERLALSEREALKNAREAERNAEDARKSAIAAKASQQKAELETEKERRTAALAQIALAEAAENDDNGEEMQRELAKVPEDLRTQEWAYLKKRADSADRTIEAKGRHFWMAWAAHPLKPGVMLALQADGWIRCVDLSTGQQDDLIEVGLPAVAFENSSESSFESSLAVSEDGKRIAVVFKDSRIYLPAKNLKVLVYDVSAGRRLFESVASETEKAITSVQLNQNGSLLLWSFFSKSSRLEAWDVDQFNPQKPLWQRLVAGEYESFAALFSADSKVKVVSKTEGILNLAARTGDPVDPPRPNKMLSKGLFGHGQVALADQGNFMAFVDGAECAISKNGGLDAKSITVNDNSSKIASLENGNMLAILSYKSDSGRGLELRYTSDLRRKRTVPVFMSADGGSGPNDWALFTHPASDHVAIIRGRLMKVWDPIRGMARPEKNDWASPVSFLGRSSTLLALTPTNNKAGEYNFRLLEILKDSTVAAAAVENLGSYVASEVSVSRDGSHVAVGTREDGGGLSVTILTRKAEGINKQNFTLPLELAYFRNQFSLNQNGATLWTGLGVIDAMTGKTLKALDRRLLSLPPSIVCLPVWLDDSTVLEVAFPVDGTAEKQYGTKGRLLVAWNLDQGKPTLTAPANDALYLSVSPDGTKVAEAGRDMKVRIRNAKTLREEQTLRVHDGPVTCVEWHPSLPIIATCSPDGFIKIWDVRTGTLVEQFGLLENRVTRVLWSPDGLQLCGAVGMHSSVVYRPKALQPRSSVPSAPATSPGVK